MLPPEGATLDRLYRRINTHLPPPEKGSEAIPTIPLQLVFHWVINCNQLLAQRLTVMKARCLIYRSYTEERVEVEVSVPVWDTFWRAIVITIRS